MFRISYMFKKTAINESRGVMYQSGQLLPILSPKQLLNQSSYRFYFEQCQALSQLDEADFEASYVALIEVFAGYVQWLPFEWNAALGSLLNNSLARAMRCLHHFHEEYIEAAPVDRFALFSAVLLRDISAIVTNQKVWATTDDGKKLLEWSPLAGSLTQQTTAPFYRLLSVSHHFQRLAKPMTLLLARQLMPKKAFSWIAQFPALLAEWIAILEDDEGGSGRFHKILQLYETPLQNSPNITLPLPDIVEHEASATLYADQFLEWLKKGIENGEINVNTTESDVLITEQGAFLDKAIFKKFADLYHLPIHLPALYEQFSDLMGLSKEGLNHQVEQRLSSDQGTPGGLRQQNFLGHDVLRVQTQLREGALLNDPALLFGGPIPDIVTFLRHSVPMQANAQRLSSVSTPTKSPRPTL